MREFSVPATSPVAAEENLTDMVWANAERFGNAVSFRRRVDGTWVDITARDFAAQVLAVAKGLVAAGVEVAVDVLPLQRGQVPGRVAQPQERRPLGID